MKGPKSKKDYVFVGIQLVLFAIYLLPVYLKVFNFPEWLQYLGLVIFGLAIVFGVVALLQINIKFSPFPTPVANGKLITNGAYAMARHPIYSALIFSGIGYAIYQASVFKLLITFFYYSFYFILNLNMKKNCLTKNFQNT